MRGGKCSAGQAFKTLQKTHRMRTMLAAHLFGCLQAEADCRTTRITKQFATQLLIKLYARDACWLALWHAGDSRTDGGRDTASATIRPASRETSHGRHSALIWNVVIAKLYLWPGLDEVMAHLIRSIKRPAPWNGCRANACQTTRSWKKSGESQDFSFSEGDGTDVVETRFSMKICSTLKSSLGI